MPFMHFHSGFMCISRIRACGNCSFKTKNSTFMLDGNRHKIQGETQGIFLTTWDGQTKGTNLVEDFMNKAKAGRNRYAMKARGGKVFSWMNHYIAHAMSKRGLLHLCDATMMPPANHRTNTDPHNLLYYISCVKFLKCYG